MIINIAIIAILLLMAYMWSTWGGFSAVVHLICTLFALAMAFSFWELVAVGVINRYAPAYGWGVSLIVLYAIFLAVARTLTWKFVPGNMQLNALASQILGGICGAVSGFISLGVLVLGLGFLPIGVNLIGYQPFALENDNRIVPTKDGQLWLAVDQTTVTLAEKLSAGVFYSGRPLARYSPDLSRQASLFRLKADAHSSPSLVPGSVTVTKFTGAACYPDTLDPRVVMLMGERKIGEKIWVVDSVWNLKAGTYDPDGALRVFQTQARLVYTHQDEVKTMLPLAVAVGQPTLQQRKFIMFKEPKDSASGNSTSMELAWLFIVPEGATPESLFLRQTRFNLGAPQDDPASMAKMVGRLNPDPVGVPTTLVDASNPANTDPNLSGRQGIAANAAAVGIDLSNLLPKPISRNNAVGLSFDGQVIRSGRGEASPPTPGAGQNSTANALWAPGHMAMVRVRISKDQANSLLGAAMASAAMLQPMQLVDHTNQRWLPTGFSMLRDDGSQYVRFDPESPIQAVKELPNDGLQGRAELYVYFPVQRGVRITAFQIGNSTTQAVSLDIPR